MFSFQFRWLSETQPLEFSPVRVWVAEGTRSICGAVAPRNPVLCHQGHWELSQPPLPGTHLAASPRSTCHKGQLASQPKKSCSEGTGRISGPLSGNPWDSIRQLMGQHSFKQGCVEFILKLPQLGKGHQAEPKQAVSAMQLKDLSQIKDEDWEDLGTSRNK